MSIIIILSPRLAILLTQHDERWVRAWHNDGRGRRCLMHNNLLLRHPLANDYGCRRRVRCRIILDLPAVMLNIILMGVSFFNDTAFDLEVSFLIFTRVIAAVVLMEIYALLLHL
jgi:hypothetical protein